ncbi:MAG: hypothetical protein IAG13_07770 [Deltaproteobacteria bacterium]|nr:hypothetical protein [Nannocystaceae bacterium]
MVRRPSWGVLALALGCSVDSASGLTGVSGGSAASTTVGTMTSAAETADDDSGSGDATGGTQGASEGSGSDADSNASEDSGTPADSSGIGSDSGISDSSSSGGGEGTALDPQLDIPDMGEHCTNPGDLNECPGISVCRFATVEYGICESCDNCGNLNAPCVEGTDCDILFSCFAGACTNFCTLGTFECGPVEDCLDVGHPTRGVCNPFA